MTSDDVAEFCRRKDHRQHTPGAPQAPEWSHYMGLPAREMPRLANRMQAVAQMDRAWTVMLHRQGLIPLGVAQKLLKALKEADSERGWGGEDWIKKKLDGDEDTASAVNYGRTLQEPMARMQMREALLEVIDELHQGMEVLLALAEEHAETVMAGQSHFSHAQPTTYGAYLLAVHDGFARGLAQIELAYRHTNMNSGGCGACSGTGWPVDRQLVTDLLGFDKLIELAYDCEGSQDEIPQILFALSSVMLTLSRTAMDHSIWSLEEVDMLQSAPEWLGVSSFMPQKAHTPGMFGNIRIACDDVIGRMMTGVVTFKGEAIQDVLPVYKSPTYVLEATCHARKGLGLFHSVLSKVRVNKARMWEIVRNGYSGAPDLAITMVREKGYGGRRAHRILCNAVRMARERGIKPYEMTGELVDAAARFCVEPEPHLTSEEVQDAMGLEHFLDKHSGLGDPCPSETRRMADVRARALGHARARQTERRQRLAAADRRLQTEIDAILSAAS